MLLLPLLAVTNHSHHEYTFQHVLCEGAHELCACTAIYNDPSNGGIDTLMIHTGHDDNYS